MRKGRGEITKVGDLFAKYRATLKAPQASVIAAFCEVVEDVLEISIKKDRVQYNPRTQVLSVQGGGPLKTEIKLHQKEIITHLKGRLGPKSAPKEIF